MKINAKYVTEITATDPDTGGAVQVGIYKLDTGGMVGIDSSFLLNTDESVYSPYDDGVELDVDSEVVA